MQHFVFVSLFCCIFPHAKMDLAAEQWVKRGEARALAASGGCSEKP